MMRLMMEAAMVMAVLVVMVLLVKLGAKKDNPDSTPAENTDSSDKDRN